MSDTVKYKLVDKGGFLESSGWTSECVGDYIFEGRFNNLGHFDLSTGGYVTHHELKNFFELVTDNQKDQGYVYEGKERVVVHGGGQWNPLGRGEEGNILVYAGSNPVKNYNVMWGFDYNYNLQGDELTVQQFLDKYDPERQVKEDTEEQDYEVTVQKFINKCNPALEDQEEPKTGQKGNPKYDVTIVGKYGTGSCVVDVYSVLEAFGVTIPQLQHSVKKELKVGNRGHKDIRQDLVDIRDSTQSALDAYDAKIKLK